MTEVDSDEAAILAELQRRKAPPCSLIEFFKESWHITEPGTPYIHGWHMDALAEHLEAVTRGEIKNLLINVPPGTSKSTMVCVAWPTWRWTFNPEWRALLASYADSLSLRDASKARLLLESDWYRSNFRPPWTLSKDTNSKGYYQNTRLGFRLSTSVGGAGTGLRGNTIIVDDPMNAKVAPSKAAREEVISWWDQAFSNRLNSMEKGERVIIMQRLHEDDLSGHVLAKGLEVGGRKFEHLCLPMEFETKRRCRTSLRSEAYPDGFEDPRTVDGEILQPSRFPPTVLAEEKIDKGSAGYAGQYQQRPAPEGGNKFRKDWWRFWKVPGLGPAVGKRPDGCSDAVAVPLPTRFDEVVISVDCNFKAVSRALLRKETDAVAAWVVGRVGANKFVLARRHGRVGIKETMDWIRELRAEFPRARRILVEDKANGSAVIEVLSDELDGLIPIQPEGGKEARAAACEPQLEAGNIYLPDGAPLLDAVVEEFALFPNGKHDDDVDALTQALVWWIKAGKEGAARARKLGAW